MGKESEQRQEERDRLMVISARCHTIWTTITAAKASKVVEAKISLSEEEIFRPLDAASTALSPAMEGDMSRT